MHTPTLKTGIPTRSKGLPMTTPSPTPPLTPASGECEGRFALKSNGSAYRRALFKLERGICVSCRLDCHTLVKRLQVGGARGGQVTCWQLVSRLNRFLPSLRTVKRNTRRAGSWGRPLVQACRCI